MVSDQIQFRIAIEHESQVFVEKNPKYVGISAILRQLLFEFIQFSIFFAENRTVALRRNHLQDARSRPTDPPCGKSVLTRFLDFRSLFRQQEAIAVRCIVHAWMVARAL